MKCSICGRKIFFTMNKVFSEYEGLLLHMIMKHPETYDKTRKELESFRRKEETTNAKV